MLATGHVMKTEFTQPVSNRLSQGQGIPRPCGYTETERIAQQDLVF